MKFFHDQKNYIDFKLDVLGREGRGILKYSIEFLPERICGPLVM